MCMNNWRKGLLALLALAGIITLVGLVWLWPSAATKAGEDFPPPPRLHREIVESIRQHDRERAVETLRRDICTLDFPK